MAKPKKSKGVEAAGHVLPWLVLAGVAAALAIDSLGSVRRGAGPSDHPASPRRGRRASLPWDIPAAGWKDILWRFAREVVEDDVLTVARGVAFSGILALFPALAAFVSIYGLFADVGTAREHLAALTGLVPAAALTMIGDQMVRIASANDAGLSVTALLGVLVALWSANAGVKSLFRGLNIAFEEREKRGFLKLQLAALAFTVGGVLFVALAASAIIAVPVALKVIGAQGLIPLLAALRWPVLLAVMVAGLALLYRFGPSREDARWAWVSPGAVAAALLWMAASILFSWYLTGVADYEAAYGPLGAIFGLMIWLWLSAIVILLGAELNAEVEHQTARDSTTGEPEPLGRRGATMADQVGRPAPTRIVPADLRNLLGRKARNAPGGESWRAAE